jgi:hypothetical protein
MTCHSKPLAVRHGLIWIDFFHSASEYSKRRWEGAFFSVYSLLVPANICRRRWRTKGSMTMSDATLVLDQAEQELLTFQVSDEALETAAGSVKENAFTLGSCTGMSVCPMTAPV